MIEKILNLTEEELINKLLEKDTDGSYKDLINRELKVFKMIYLLFGI